MKQLELRSYPRAEIAEILSVNIKDSSHFKRNVENKLSKWGYGFHYTTAAVEILSKPETAEERLSEILYRGYGIDIQVSAQQFACFLTAFTDIEGFCSMPWEERANEYFRRYGFSVHPKTLRNWCSKLVTRGVVSIGGASTMWITIFKNGKKIRRPVEECDEETKLKYYARRRELYKANYRSFLDSGSSTAEAKSQAWNRTYNELWDEFRFCFYYCKNTALSAFSYNDIDVFEIYELAQEIAPTTPPAETKIIKVLDVTEQQ